MRRIVAAVRDVSTHVVLKQRAVLRRECGHPVTVRKLVAQDRIGWIGKTFRAWKRGARDTRSIYLSPHNAYGEFFKSRCERLAAH